MKKSVILAIAAAVIVGGIYAAIAEEQKAAAPQATATAPQPTAEAAKPAPAPATTTEATATKPAQPTGTTPAASPTTPGQTNPATTTTAALNKLEVRFNVKGLTTKEAADSLKGDLAKASGVYSVNVDQLTGNITAWVDPSKTTADKLCNWVKTNKPTYTCTLTK